MLELLAAGLIAFASPPVHHATPIKHGHGCRTTRCVRRVGRAWWRHHRPPIVFATGQASYYTDAGGTACGTHATYGFAHLGPGESAEGWTPALGGLACGARVRVCAARCVTATMDDHGPYIAGREFDLNEGLKDAIGAGDLGSVRYAVVR